MVFFLIKVNFIGFQGQYDAKSLFERLQSTTFHNVILGFQMILT